VNSVLILDPQTVQNFVSTREVSGIDRFDEVWDGRLVVPAAPNNDHARLVSRLNSALNAVIDWDRGDQCFPNANVSDRDVDWAENFRVPDVLVYLAGNPAKDRGTHWIGGPDFVIEILSPGEKPDDKFEFYAKINTGEVLIVDRSPWSLELFRLMEGQLVSTGKTDLVNSAGISSASLPLSFRLIPGKPRPLIELIHSENRQRWVM